VTQPRERISYREVSPAPAGNQRIELLDGELRYLPPLLPRYQAIVRTVEYLLRTYREVFGGHLVVSPFDVVFSDFDVLEPDIAFFGQARRHLVASDGPVRVPPDLVVEVLDRGTMVRDRARKLPILAAHGVREYWWLDPDRRLVETYTRGLEGFHLLQLAGGHEVVQSAALPGLAYFASDFFDDPRAHR